MPYLIPIHLANGFVLHFEGIGSMRFIPIVNGQEMVPLEFTNVAIPYNLMIRLSMISANGNVDKMLGIARNIPFLVSNITLYLQVHVLWVPAYDILLRCPFDMLTKLVICNYLDKNQTITICDSNTGCTATIPTV